MGYTDGVFRLELLGDRESGEAGELCGECAGRRGGAMVEEEVKLKHGFSLAGAAVDVALRRSVKLSEVTDGRYIGATYLHLSPRTILRLAEPRELQRLGFVHDAEATAETSVHVLRGSERSRRL
ncbi:hypothetical protein AB0B78_01120 [Streptomyces sp. NPDC040724]|uniref:hypothetical protein n=1 Tax=Streptomyces sp. NPDC040724 TaxID=3155612 RepID=UPI0033EC3384